MSDGSENFFDRQRIENEPFDLNAYRNIEFLEEGISYPCPKCRKNTDSLKGLYFADWMLCAIIHTYVWESMHFACPSCMRKILRRRLALNILTANLAWPGLLIIYLPRYMETYRLGHSRKLTEELKPPRTPPKIFVYIRRFFDRTRQHMGTYIVLIVLAFSFGNIAFTGRHESFDAIRVILAVTASLLGARIFVDFRNALRAD